MNLLSDTAVIASVNITGWGGRPKDQRQITKLASELEVSSRDVNVTLNLLGSGSWYLERITSVGKRARACSQSFMVGSTGSGKHLLPVALLQDHAKKMDAYKDEFVKAVEDLATNYEELVKDALVEWGGALSKDDFPSHNELLAKFFFDVEISPVPTANSFSDKLGVDDYLKHHKKRIIAEEQSKMKDATKHVYKSTVSQLEKLVGLKTKMRDDTLEIIRTHVAMMPKLNISKCSKLDAVHLKMRELIDGINIDATSDEAVRDDLNKNAKAIMDDFMVGYGKRT